MSGGSGRASNGRSSILKGGVGAWHGFVFMGRSGEGKVVRRHVRGKTKAEVSAKVEALETERTRTARRPASPKRVTVGQWLDEWLIIIKRTRKPKTFDNYSSLVRRHCIGLRSLQLTRLSVRDIDDLLDAVFQSAPQSAVTLHRILRSSFNTAIKRGLLTANPCVHAVVPRVRQEELEPYDLEECRAILLAAQGDPDAARWSVALALGLRQSEVLGLQWDDVDFNSSQILPGAALSAALATRRRAGRTPCPPSVGNAASAEAERRIAREALEPVI